MPFFRDLDGVSPRQAEVGHHDQVARFHQFGLTTEQKVDAVAIPALFVRHQKQSHVPRRTKAFLVQRPQPEKRSGQPLLVVFDPPPYQAIALHSHLERIPGPGSEGPGRHRI